MNVSCKNCKVLFRIDDSKIPSNGAKVRCPKCKDIFIVKIAVDAIPQPAQASSTPPPSVSPNPEHTPMAPQAPSVSEAKALSSEEAPKSAPGDEEDYLKELGVAIKNIQRGLVKISNGEADGMKSEAKTLVKAYQAIKKDIKGLEDNIQEIKTLVKISKAITSVLDMDELLNMIMDSVIKVMSAERGFLMLKDEATGELVVKVARNMDAEMKDKRLHTISTSITSKVAAEKKPILTTDAKTDERFSQQASVMGYGLRSLLCVPLIIKDKVLGIIYIDNRMLAGAFNEHSVEVIMSFANQAAVAIENAKLYKNVRQETKARSNLQRYLSPNLVDDILKKKETLVLGGEKIEVSILFSDICGFTPMSEKMRPEDVVALLNEYFTAMTKIIFKRHGTLDKFIGDAIMAVFGAPIFDPQGPLNAVRAAFEMQAALTKLNQNWALTGKTTFDMRVGVNTGIVVAGNIGSDDRMDYTVIGDNVNLASRLESGAQPGKVLISQSTYEKVKDDVVVDTLDPIKVKGKSNLIPIFEVKEITAPAEEEAFKRKFDRKSVNLYATFNFEGAMQIHQGTVTNISVGGLSLTTRGATQAGQQLYINFSLTDQLKLEKIPCRVSMVRNQKDDAGNIYHKVGVAFLDVPSSLKEKMEQFVGASK